MDDRVFDDSSIVASLRKMFGLAAEPLTRRDAQANGFHDMMVRIKFGRSPICVQRYAERLGAHGPESDAGRCRHQAMDEFQASLVVLARGSIASWMRRRRGAPGTNRL